MVWSCYRTNICCIRCLRWRKRDERRMSGSRRSPAQRRAEASAHELEEGTKLTGAKSWPDVAEPPEPWPEAGCDGAVTG